MQSLFIAFSMYSRLPVPHTEWNEENMAYALCWFPFVGFILGIIELAAFSCLEMFGAGPVFKGAVLACLPVFITGGIHLDGFMDTADARSSFADRKRKLDILKDSHVGSFAVIHLAVYMMLSMGAWSMADRQTAMIMCCTFVIERAVSALAAINIKGAREDGMLAAFTVPAKKKTVSVILAFIACGGAMISAYIWSTGGLICISAVMIMLLLYRHMALNEFGGVTGDLAGWFLQVCELTVLMALIIYKMGAAL